MESVGKITSLVDLITPAGRERLEQALKHWD